MQRVTPALGVVLGLFCHFRPGIGGDVGPRRHKPQGGV